MGFTRRSDRPVPARRRRGSNLETLETRQLLTGGSGLNFLNSTFYRPSDLPSAYSANALGPNSIAHPVGSSPALLSTLNNEGKVVSGRDRLGDLYTITVRGPGTVIVTDATPTDGVLDDDIATIQLVGTSLTRTTVTGTVSASAEVSSSGTIRFNKLIAQSGVKSINLNGFILSQTVTPPNNGAPQSNSGVYLLGGVQQLSFQGIESPIDLASNTQPMNVVIGDPSTPLRFKPSIRIDQITNTVFDSTSTVVPTQPQLFPTVNIIVNGETHSLQIVSATQAVVDPAMAYLFPIVGTTGRTTVQTLGIDHLVVKGSAKNFTASRSAVPFQNGFSGLNHLGTADFGGNADAVGLDVNGPVGGLRFARGLGSPVGVTTAATSYGTPDNEIGYPGNGLVGGLVTAGSVGHIVAAPANTILQYSQNPALIQSGPRGTTTYYPRAGAAFSSVAIVSAGSIGKTTVVGDATNTEIKSGVSYASAVAGLQGCRSGSSIGSVKYRGDLVDSVISASYRAGAHGYGTPGSLAGNGTIRGRFIGSLYNTGNPTILNNKGAGFYAKHKSPSLQPPETPKRTNGVLTR